MFYFFFNLWLLTVPWMHISPAVALAKLRAGFIVHHVNALVPVLGVQQHFEVTYKPLRLVSAAYLEQWGRRGRCGACCWPERCRCRAPRRSPAPCQCGWRSRCCCCWPAWRACPATTCPSPWKGCWSGWARPCGSPPRQSDICVGTGSHAQVKEKKNTTEIYIAECCLFIAAHRPMDGSNEKNERWVSNKQSVSHPLAFTRESSVHLGINHLGFILKSPPLLPFDDGG